MFNKGRAQYRFKQNPLEEQFAIIWEQCNRNNEYGILDYLLAEIANKPQGEVTNRDREVAATVIQWLGSYCGQEFIKEVNKNYHKRNN